MVYCYLDRVLAPRDDPTTLDFKSSCETCVVESCMHRNQFTYHQYSYLRQGFVAQPSSTDGALLKAIETPSYGIASVFTPPAFRNKGYAKHMMRLLHYVLAPHSVLPPFPEAWGAPPESKGHGRFSVLYSDVGDLYSVCGPHEEGMEGWTIRSAFGTIWDVSPTPPTSGGEQQEGEWEWLDLARIDELLEEDAEVMKSDLIASTQFSGRTSFMILPRNWATLQSKRVLLTPSIQKSNWWGVLLKDSAAPSQRTFATWTVDRVGPLSSQTPILVITRLRATPLTFPPLLSKLLSVATEFGMKHVEAWNLPKELQGVASELGGKTAERDEHLPAFKWYGTEDPREIDWSFNEK